MKRRIAVLLLCAMPALALADDGPVARTLSADIPAATLKNLKLHIGVGEVHVTASRDDKVHVQVTLRQKEQEFLWFFHWKSGGTAADIAAASISQRQEGDALDLGLNYKGDTDSDNLKQEWEVQVPARLALDTDMKVGELNIKDVAGGVEASLNVGELDIQVPRGSMKAQVNVGEIRARTGSADYGRIKLSSSIGEALLIVNGEHGGSHDHGGLGNSVSAEGKGHDDMNLSVNVGEVSLRIESQGDGKQDKGK
ncbi:MAG TPA: hypothetical protein VGT99_09025 [Gammaproteobacteria bacterium]|nr:hypothetical protein [Gammaproteobacteria bacterium]